jgi:hypothetical protein
MPTRRRGWLRVAEDLLNDLDEALTPWRAIYEPMGWSVNLTGRVLHEDGRHWFQLAEK